MLGQFCFDYKTMSQSSGNPVPLYEETTMGLTEP